MGAKITFRLLILLKQLPVIINYLSMIFDLKIFPGKIKERKGK